MLEDRKLAAIVFSDIAGYSALMGRDERKAYEMIRRNRKIQTDLIQQYNGQFLKEMGDGILASFQAVSNAVRCAIAIQQVAGSEQIPLKIGIHEGEVIIEKNDVFGDGVNIAARLEQATDPGCISISESVYNNIKNKPEIKTEFLGEKKFKNIENPLKIYRVLFDPDTEHKWDLEPGVVNKKYGRRKVYPLIVLLVLFIAVLLFMIPKRMINNTPAREKSIAVLPFDNESAEEQNAYFVNGMMEDIRNNLAKIGDLRVISKTSTEQYRDKDKSIKEIGRELNVSFLLEGTVQKSGDQVKIHAQLIDTRADDHIWVETYIRDIGDVFLVQSEIAQAIAGELYAVITPGELEIIEKVPTSNVDAYDIFLQAREQHNQFWLSYNLNTEALEKAVILYRRSLEYDSTFARAYTGLAQAYWDKYYWERYFDEDLLDSVLVLTNIALSYDDQLDEAYFVRGRFYYNQNRGAEQALSDYRTAIEINPNYVQAYSLISLLYAWHFDDFVEGLKHMHRAVDLDKSAFLPRNLTRLGDLYSSVGFGEEAKKYYRQALMLDNDSAVYYFSMVYQYQGEGDILKANKTAQKCYALDSNNIHYVVPMILYNSILGHDEAAYAYALKLLQLFERQNMVTPNDWHRIGYAFWKKGLYNKADYYFEEQEKWALESIKLHRRYGNMFAAHYDLACIYALRGEWELAYQYLDEINSKNFIPQWWLVQFTVEPFFESIRNEERFKVILQELEEKYNKEHERVQHWLKTTELPDENL